MRTMQEFLLWSNCTNKCAFCWQQKKKDLSTFLNEKEMLECITETSIRVDSINDGDDVLLVGGEILASYFSSVNLALHKLIDKCIELLKSDRIRYLYINTNLLYIDRTNLDYLLGEVKGIEDRLKFTTSFDIYGRFETGIEKSIFLDNLAYIRDNYPNINVVVNSIITKQLVASDFDFENFKAEYKVSYINFIPYIPVTDERCMDVEFKDIIKILADCERKSKGYIKHYIDDLDLNQNKVLYEYHKDSGYKECTSKYAFCGHNENFRKVLGDECYICKLKDLF